MIAVDLDRTIAVYESGWYETKGPLYIGEPINLMVSRVQAWLARGVRVVIFTSRPQEAYSSIEEWCLLHVGQKLPITNVKSHEIEEFWDDRAVSIVPNTGMRIDDYMLQIFDQEVASERFAADLVFNQLESIVSTIKELKLAFASDDVMMKFTDWAKTTEEVIDHYIKVRAGQV